LRAQLAWYALTRSKYGGADARRDVKTYMCLICGFIYSEAAGRPEEGIPPGTKWADIPLSWRCPDCGSGKEDFEMVEV
jgi:rubredoxin